MDGVRSRGRALARLMAVCTVLFGLFLMHGAPATAANGCHGAVPMSMPVSMSVSGGHAAAHGGGASAAATAPMAGTGSAHTGSQVVFGEHGAQCVATPVRDRLTLPSPSLLAFAAVVSLCGWALTGRRVIAGEAGRRGPPGGGRAVLLKLGVART
ncbi:hypothetical protein K2224_07725 [Streptomyces sp. BHT-5-2]|uniref:hypothetical protein n=1 Tax=Streptomyces sp. BHT-5-2 TaxID=2866715 RepID=UPI001C8E2D07|nr:hypothetical protein [Streptomyces sp. BHT-5-2]QZL03113.1 hypothetical protein K2224_07725 [Streptomyces sp. BHT-5-2]